ncbi:hypothetical protein Tco_0266214 [Tanacetum coccineum]
MNIEWIHLVVAFRWLPNFLSSLTWHQQSHIHNFSIVFVQGTAGESSVTGTTGVATIVGVYGPLRMHFRKASPFGLVSMYHKNRDRHCAYRPVASIGG